MPRIAWPRINRDDPEAEGLQFCAVATPAGMLDLVSGTWGTRAGTADTLPTSDQGHDAFFDGDADQYGFGTTQIIDTANPFTLVWEAQLTSFIDAFPAIAYLARGVASTPFQLLYSNNASYDDICAGWGSGSNDIAFLRPASVALTGERHWGVWSYLGGTWNVGTNHNVWLNGLTCTSASCSTFGARTDQNVIGGSSGTTEDWNGVIAQFRVYNRTWTDAEVLRYWNPATRGGLFAPRRRFFGGVSSAAASFTITPSGGIVLSGAASQIHGKVLSPIGGIALSGAASQIHGKVLLPDGGISLGGSAAQLHGKILAPGGGLTFLGTAPMIFSGTAVSAQTTRFRMGRHTMRSDVWTGMH